jgi:hypothetical protein
MENFEIELDSCEDTYDILQALNSFVGLPDSDDIRNYLLQSIDEALKIFLWQRKFADERRAWLAKSVACFYLHTGDSIYSSENTAVSQLLFADRYYSMLPNDQRYCENSKGQWNKDYTLFDFLKKVYPEGFDAVASLAPWFRDIIEDDGFSED